MKPSCLFLLTIAAVLGPGCRGTAVLQPVAVEAELVPVRTLKLQSAAVAVGADGSELLVLEASGARVLRFDSAFAPVETIPLTERVVGPRGIEADRFYIYVHDDRTLHRLAKENPVLTRWLHGVRTAGLARFAPGEMLVSDAERSTVWHKAMFGESRRFLDASELPRPGALTALPEGKFAALSGGSVLARFNRAGIILDRQELPEAFDLMTSDRQGTLYLGSRGRPGLVTMQPDGRSFRYGLGGEPALSGLAVLPGGVAVLDRDARLLLYRLP